MKSFALVAILLSQGRQNSTAQVDRLEAALNFKTRSLEPA